MYLIILQPAILLSKSVHSIQKSFCIKSTALKVLTRGLLNVILKLTALSYLSWTFFFCTNYILADLLFERHISYNIIENSIEIHVLSCMVVGVGRSIGAPMHRDYHIGNIQIDTPVYERRYTSTFFLIFQNIRLPKIGPMF